MSWTSLFVWPLVAILLCAGYCPGATGAEGGASGRVDATDRKILHEEKEPGGEPEPSEEIRPRMTELKEELEEKDRFEIHAGVVSFYQGSAGDCRIDGDNTGDASAPGFAADIMMTLRPGVGVLRNGRIFFRAHFGYGKGADEKLGDKLLANLNTIADNSASMEDFDGDDVAQIPEIYYAHEFMDGKLTAVAGKTETLVFIDNNNYANNAYSQFVGKPFVNNPALDCENGFAPIVSVNYVPLATLAFTATVASSSFPEAPDEHQKKVQDHWLDGPLFAAQIAYSPKVFGRDGNYRLYFWESAYDHRMEGAEGGEDGWGIGMSLDQQLTEKIGIFARFSYSNEDAYEFDWFWSGGVNLKSLIPSRENDEIGIGIASLRATGDQGHYGTEFHAEAYYRIYLTKFFALSPDIQYVVNPLGDSGNDHIFAGMIRGEFLF